MRLLLNYLFIIFVLFFSSHLFALRIVSLSPNLTEMLFEIGAGGELVGVDTASDYPLIVQRLPKIASYQSLELEKIIALKPDLIVAWPHAGQEAQFSELRKFGLNVHYIRASNLADIAVNLEELGRLTGHTVQAQHLAQVYRVRLKALQMKYSKRKTHSVFYQLWFDPLMTVNQSSVTAQVFEVCGITLLFVDRKSAILNLEEVILAQPDIIVMTDKSRVAFWRKWLPQTVSVVFPGRDIERYTPRVLNATDQLCRLI